jgi:hypothetical protein
MISVPLSLTNHCSIVFVSPIFVGMFYYCLLLLDVGCWRFPFNGVVYVTITAWSISVVSVSKSRNENQSELAMTNKTLKSSSVRCRMVSTRRSSVIVEPYVKSPKDHFSPWVLYYGPQGQIPVKFLQKLVSWASRYSAVCWSLPPLR